MPARPSVRISLFPVTVAAEVQTQQFRDAAITNEHAVHPLIYQTLATRPIRPKRYVETEKKQWLGKD